MSQFIYPLDPDLNAAIVDIAGRVLPSGVVASPNAPSTYEELCQVYRTGRPVVWDGGSLVTIYGDPIVNFAFRGWHDWLHWLTAQPFTLEGEVAVCTAHCRQLLSDFHSHPRIELWLRIMEAEVIGQARFAQMHKRFPDDQIGFVTAYLKDPLIALLWSLW